MYDDLEKNLRSMKKTESVIDENKVNADNPFQANMNLHKQLEENTSINGMCEACNKEITECVCPPKKDESVDDAKPDGNETTPTPTPKDAKPDGNEDNPSAAPAGDAKPKGTEDEPKNNETPLPEKKPITDSNDDSKPDGNETTPTPIPKDAKPDGNEDNPPVVPAGDAKPTGAEDEPKNNENITVEKKVLESFGPLELNQEIELTEGDIKGKFKVVEFKGTEAFVLQPVKETDEGKVVDPSAVDPDAAHNSLIEAAVVKIKEMATAVPIKEDINDKIFFGSRGTDSFYVEELKDEGGVLQGMNLYNNVDDLILSTSDNEYSVEDPALLIQSIVNDLGLDAVSFQYMVDLGVLAPPPEDEEIVPDESNPEDATQTGAEADKDTPTPPAEEDEEIKPEDDEKKDEAKVADVSQDLDKIKNDLLEKHGLK